MSAPNLDVEVYADREDDVRVLFAEPAADDGAEHEVPRRDDKLPPIIQNEGLGDDWDTWGEAA